MIAPYKEKEDCCGCGVCSEFCKRNAIQMIEDEEGFLYPSINENSCVDCGICMKVCGFKCTSKSLYDQTYWALKSKNTQVRSVSRSGGAFYHLAKNIILMGGSVYGVILDEDNNVIYARITKIEDIHFMQGSKYVEAEIQGIYNLVNRDLLSGKKVLFSGTGCQIAALKSYLTKLGTQIMENLYLVDIVCHGVSTRKIFRDYIEFLESKYRGTVTKFNFRDKLYGWDSTIESFFINGKKHYSESYISLFFSKYGMRPSCAACRFTNFNRPSDITLSDFWGGSQDVLFNDNKGMSAIILNSEKGRLLFDSIRGECECIQITKEQCQQPRLSSPSVMPSNRMDFWNVYKTKGFSAILQKYGRCDIVRKFKFKFVMFLKRMKL